MTNRLSCASFVALFLLAAGAARAEGPEYRIHPIFSQSPGVGCAPADRGRYQAICKYYELGSIDGRIGQPDAVSDPRWARLSRYHNDMSHRLKFVGTGCGRGTTPYQAEAIARGRAMLLVEQLTELFEDHELTGKLSPLGYREDKSMSECKQVKSDDQQQPAEPLLASNLDDGKADEAIRSAPLPGL